MSRATVRLAFELPTAALEQISPLADLDFVIAYRVLQDEAYGTFYSQRRVTGRELILDNGLFELGAAADWPELAAAAERVRPDFIICPDRLNDGAFNLMQLDRAVYELDAVPARLGVVITGRSRAEREALVRAAMTLGVGLLCFPHTETRLAWWKELAETFGEAFVAKRLHLLGFIDFEELSAWRKVGLPAAARLSMDTSKLAKLAAIGRRMDDGGQLRGLLAAKLVFDLQLSAKALDLCRMNASILWLACNGVTAPASQP